MRELKIEKVNLNIGTGGDQNRLEKGMKLLEKITERKPVKTKTQKRVPSWGIRPGLPIGCKVTLRRNKAQEVLKNLLDAADYSLSESCFDENGNVAFGLKEYIDIPGIKYDPEIGAMGLQVTVTLERKGHRIKKRKIQKKKIPSKQRISKSEAMDFIKNNYNVKVGEE